MGYIASANLQGRVPQGEVQTSSGPQQHICTVPHRHMVDQSAINLKSTVDLMEKDIRVLQGAKACVLLDVFNKLDSKVATLICLNNLKLCE
jgi:hypothetical protein